MSPGNFLAWRCNDLDLSEDAVERSCPINNEEFIPMGEWTDLFDRPEGIFYLTTNGQMPFSCPAYEFEC